MEKFLQDLVDHAHSLVDFDDDDPLGGYAYLRGRGVSDDQIRTFKLGFGPKSIKAPEDTEDGRRFNRQYRGSMAGSVVMPLYNPSGTLRGFETRMWEERKYSHFMIEGWKEDAVFLGTPQVLDVVWQTQTVFLVEGMFDFFPVQRVFPNTLSPLTAKLTHAQLRFLRRWAKNVVFLFDRDTKGMNYSNKLIDQYNVTGDEGWFYVHRMNYPAKDPGQLYELMGVSRFEAHLRRQADGMNLHL
jgi:DNA primase